MLQVDDGFRGTQCRSAYMKRSITAVCICALWLIAPMGTSCAAEAVKNVKGAVRDAETGAPLPVAHIREAGTRNGTISNDDGLYTLGLTALPATVIVSYIGYSSEKITVNGNSPDELDIHLVPSPVMIETVVVHPEDEAIRIMRRVIEKKKEWLPNMRTVTTEAYTRASLSNDTRIAFISESLSDVYYDTERGSREIIRHMRQTKNVKAGANIASARMTPNLYYDDIDIVGYDCIGPTHPDAIEHYRFRIAETRFIDTTKVFVIALEPKSILQPAFNGTVSILDGEFAMIEADLTPSDAVRIPPPLKDFRFTVSQKFSSFGEDYWLPVDVEVTAVFKIKLPGLEFPAINYRQLTRFSEYDVNVTLPDSLFKGGKNYITMTASNESITVKAGTKDTEGNIAETPDTGNRKPEAPSETTTPSVSADTSRSGASSGHETASAQAARTVASAPPSVESTPDVESGVRATADADASESETDAGEEPMPEVKTSDPAVPGSDTAGEFNDDAGEQLATDSGTLSAQEQEAVSDTTGSARNAARALADSIAFADADTVPYTDEEQTAYATLDSTLTLDEAFKPKGPLARLLMDEDKKKKKHEKKEPGPVGKLLKKLPDIEPKVRHNRVDGWTPGIGWDHTYRKRYTLALDGEYGFGAERWAYGGSAAYSFGENRVGSVKVSAATVTAPLYGADRYPLWMNSSQTLLWARDYYDYYRNDRAGIDASYKFEPEKLTATAGVSFEHHAPLDKTVNGALYHASYVQRPNPAIATGQIRSARLGLRWREMSMHAGFTGAKGAVVEIEHSSPRMLDSDAEFTRVDTEAAWRFETFLRRRIFPCTLDMYMKGGIVAGTPPVERFGALDGTLGVMSPFGTFRSMRNRQLAGERWYGLFMEHNFRTVPFELLQLNWLADRNVTVILHGAAGRSWLSKEKQALMPYVPYRDRLTSEIGFSVNTIYSLFRIDVTKRLDSSGGTVGVWLARYM